MKKILVISTSGFSKKEGISTVLIDNLGRFDKLKFDIHVVVQGDYDKELITEISNVGISCKFIPSRKNSVFKYIYNLIHIFLTEKYHAVYVHGSSAIMSIELLIAFLCGCKVRIVHSHNTTCNHKMADKMLRPLFYHLYTDALACGEEAGKWLYGNRNFTIIKNGRDVSVYSFDEVKRKNIREQLQVGTNSLLVGNVGNFIEQKNHAFTLKVFNELLSIRPDSYLYLMGTGPKVEEIKQLAKELGIYNKVIFTGTVRNIPDMLQAMDVMILPSLFEGVPLVAIEWQMSALPSLISDSVSKECCFSDLVHFISLDEKCDVWAKKIIDISKGNRNDYSKSVIGLAEKAGFDLNQSSKMLQEFFE